MSVGLLVEKLKGKYSNVQKVDAGVDEKHIEEILNEFQHYHQVGNT